MLTIIPLPQNATSDIIGYVSQIFTDLSPVITLIIGLFLAVAVIGLLLSIFTNR
jgi:hypothetical protein